MEAEPGTVQGFTVTAIYRDTLELLITFAVMKIAAATWRK